MTRPLPDLFSSSVAMATAILTTGFVLVCTQGTLAQTMRDETDQLVYYLPGFSGQSGLRVGQVYEPPLPPTGNETVEEPDPLPVIYDSRVLGNESEFTVCLRFKSHYQRPEFVLFSAYNYMTTIVEIGVDEVKGEIYFKHSVSSDSAELSRASFEWLPRHDLWEHVCFVKTAVVDSEFNRLDFYLNGNLNANKTEFVSEISNVTLALLGQTEPPSLETSFSGDITHFVIMDEALSPDEVLALSSCSFDQSQLALANEELKWTEGAWSQVLEVKPNSTEASDIDRHALPIGMYIDQREVCNTIAEDREHYLLPIYRKRSMEFHEEICSGLGGKFGDITKLLDDEDALMAFAERLFVSARIPTIIQPVEIVPEPAEEGEEEKEEKSDEEASEEELDVAPPPEVYKTPLNMLSCFVNDGLVVWLKNKTKSADDEDDEEESEDCPYYISRNGTIERKCEVDPEACSICLFKHDEAPIKIRGLCEKSWIKNHREGEVGTGNEEFDTQYFPKNDKLTGEVVFRGVVGSRIRKEFLSEEAVEDRSGDWILESLISPWRQQSSAVVHKIPSAKLPIGRNSWEMVTKICAEELEDSETALISLTSCSESQYTCKPGNCIPLSYRCDIYHDCEEGDDEDECEFLTVDEDYKPQIAPRHVKKGKAWPIYIGIEIVSFPQIIAIEQRLAVDFYLSMRWYDPRLDYHNLKTGKEENPLNPELLYSLWIPRLGLLNGLSEFQTIVTEDDAKFYRGYVWRRNKPKVTGIENAIEDGLFEGTKNPILVQREFYQEFKCDFDLSWYPFDRQLCFMNFTIQGHNAKSIVLKAEDRVVKYLGQKYLVEYTVEGQELIIPKIQSSGNYSTASVLLHFRRRVVYHLLNIFMQSFLLVMTGYMSLFFHVNNFSDRVMVALTVMLVMASLQSSIQESLPKTAYFKFIDWWILISLNTQIMLMAWHTFLGFFCDREYRKYKEEMAKTRRQSIGNNLGFEPGKISLGTSESYGSFDPEDILSPEEFKYPRARRLNKLINITFICLYTLFNIVYWSIAAGVYFS